MKKKRMNEKPVVGEKAERGKELEVITVPGQDGIFYKAYTSDDRPVAVPASSLEAMKSLVNVNMRPRGESLFTKMPDSKAEKQELKRYLDKLEILVDKMERFEEGETEELEDLDKTYRSIRDSDLIKIRDPERNKSISVKTPESQVVSEPKHSQPLQIPSKESIISKRSEIQTIIELDQKDSLKKNFQQEITEPQEPEIFETEEAPIKEPIQLPSDETRLTRDIFKNQPTDKPKPADEVKFDSKEVVVSPIRFLISGHIRGDKKPIFIVQPYEGPYILGNEKARMDPASAKSDNGLDVFVSGKFFQRNILEEENSIPKSITIDNHTIAVGNTSIIFEEGSTDSLSTNDVLVVIEGKFVKSATSRLYTPSLLINVQKRHTSDQGRPTSDTKPGILWPLLDICRKAAECNPFTNFFRKPQNVYVVNELPSKPTICAYTIESRGFDIFETHTEGGETIYECNSPNEPRNVSFSGGATEKEEQTVYETTPRRELASRVSSRLQYLTRKKSVYGDDSDRPKGPVCDPLNKEDSTVYECGGLKSQSEHAVTAVPGMSRSRTEYGDVGLSCTKSSQTIVENAAGKSRHRTTDFLRKINKKLFSK